MRGIDRRIDHRGITPITFAHAAADEFGIHRHQIDAMGGADIPHANVVQNGARNPRGEAAIEPGFLEVLMLEIPGVANGAVDIGDVKLAGTGDDALGDRIAGGDDEVITAKIELLDSERHKRQIGAIFLSGEGQLLDEGGVDGTPAEKAPVALAHEIDEAIEVRVRINFEKVVKHFLGPTSVGEPVMHDSRLHNFLNNFNVIKIYCPPLNKLGGIEYQVCLQPLKTRLREGE
ncbi:hypothetical protein AGR8A_Lc40315 [Agrobacterium fabrum str. J-07]|nr:hypothetical protein AGR8A_Lc40315 [Agrobacterium fabrum str. J-07]